ncbi:major facilitator superfamily domain-containing protein [Kockovaella imperatae]|uniref:Major facilitator superfamily domain-containing protein n=1 Tax=Kockovaella imperatae TaxID=4999 RepID=A0A1Y1UBZ3_9TREE|nr:major facilitator superfamily domain-containing protein [Kockovaella imperatae]ORX35561.1 major facilitator superfamily domain-containing protein [Kockovaella imperatae]
MNQIPLRPLDVTRPSESELEPEDRIVDSDFRAVIICISSFLLIFTTCGTLFSFGVFQDLYQTMSHEPGNPFSGASPAMIDLVGTLGVSFQSVFAPFATAWAKRFSPTAVSSLGGLMFLLGCILASYSTKLWQFILTQGMMLGIGTCLSNMPAVTVAPTWYGPRRGLAMGIILSGTGVGGVAWTPVIQALNQRYGFRMTLRIAGAVTAGMIVLPATLLRWDSASQRRIDQERRNMSLAAKILNIPLLDWQVANSRKFTAQLFSASCQGAAYYTPIFFFSAYARTLGYSATTGASFIAITNACNAIGKIGVGFVADKWGRLNSLFVTTLISTAITFGLWLPSTLDIDVVPSRVLFIAYSIAFGLFASPYVALFPTSLVELFGPAHFASVNGCLYMARGIAALIGTPVAGALIMRDVDSPQAYRSMTIMVGALLAAASGGVLWARIENRR